MTYSRKDSLYELNMVRLNFTVDGDLFPNAASDEKVPRSLVAGNLTEFSANVKTSYRCSSKSTIELKNVTIEITNYQGEPFLDKASTGFDTGKSNLYSLKIRFV